MDRTNYETICGIALNGIFGYEPAAARALVSRFGSPGAVFSQSSETLDAAIGHFSKYRGAVNGGALEAAATELSRLQELGCTFVPFGSPDYPKLLAECPDAPSGLYVRSRSAPSELFNRVPAISIVGTRDISPYGREWTQRIVGAISRTPSRPAIVSGFAIGVDITAHTAALDCGLPTIAVLPVGIDDVYPRRHRGVAAAIASTEGCALVTDFPPGTSPVAFNFLRRNRIIAGLSRATILAESKAQGGGTMTARLASGYGREVFCLPGRIDDVRSRGCNRLLREKIAEPLTDLETLGVQLSLGSSRKSPAASLEEQMRECYATAGEQMLDKLTGVVRYIHDRRGSTPEEIASALEVPVGDVSAAVCLLESDGFVCTDLLRRCTIDGRRLY